MENTVCKKIYLLGDSIMKGVTFDGRADNGNGRYRICCADAFDALVPKGVTVVNRSRMGATLTYADDNLEKLLGADSDGQIGLLLEYGGNDCDYDWKAVSASPDSYFDPRTTPGKFEETYRRLLGELKEKSAAIAVTNLPPIDAEKYFRHISKGLSADNILHWLGDIGALYRWQEYYNGIVEKVAAECGVRLIDIRSCFLRARNYKSLISDDGIHPTEEGHRMIREEIIMAVGSDGRETEI